MSETHLSPFFCSQASSCLSWFYYWLCHVPRHQAREAIFYSVPADMQSVANSCDVASAPLMFAQAFLFLLSLFPCLGYFTSLLIYVPLVYVWQVNF